MKYLIVSILILSGCASAPELRIDSSTPARIEVGGLTVCDETPCIVKPNYSWDFGCQYAYPINMEAFPIDKKDGYTQSKRVVGSCGKKDLVFFDMQSRSGVSTEKGSSKDSGD